MTDTMISALVFPERFSPVPIEKIPHVQVEGGSLSHGDQAAFQDRWLEATTLQADTALCWGLYRESVPRLDAEEVTQIRIEVTCTLKGLAGAADTQYLLTVHANAQEPILFGRRLTGEKVLPISTGTSSYQEKVMVFLQARIYAFAWLGYARAHFQRLFQISTVQEMLLYRSLLHLEQTEALPPAKSPLTMEDYALRCRWVERHRDATGQLIALTQKAEQTMRLLQVKGLVDGFAGEYHTVECIQGRIQQEKPGASYSLLHRKNYPAMMG